MKQSSKYLIGLALGLALVGIFLFLKYQPPLPDQTQIAAQLEAARAAWERRDVGAVMKIISERYHDSTVPSPIQLRFLLNKVAQGDGSAKITQSIPVIALEGDTATSTSHLQIVTSPDGRVVYDHDVTMHWQREDGTKLLIVPIKVWRVVSADYGGFGFE